jgi:hypothetical protein
MSIAIAELDCDDLIVRRSGAQAPVCKAVLSERLREQGLADAAGARDLHAAWRSEVAARYQESHAGRKLELLKTQQNARSSAGGIGPRA